MHTKGTAEFRAKFDLAKTRRDAKLPDHTDKDTPAPRRRGPGRVTKAKQQAAPKPASNNVMADDVSSLDSDRREEFRTFVTSVTSVTLKKFSNDVVTSVTIQ
jgi:hypothetical protein